VWWTGGGKANTNGYLPCAIKNMLLYILTKLNNGTSLFVWVFIMSLLLKKFNYFFLVFTTKIYET